jgi:DnaJ-class molecular chaperone
VEEMLEVHIEKGMKDGEKIVFRGKGDQEVGLEPGNIVIVLDEQEHETFTRAGDNLHMMMDLNLTEALCGCQKPIKTLDGRIIVFHLLPGNYSF